MNFAIENGHLMYQEKGYIVFVKERQQLIICDVSEEFGDHPKAKALALHRGKESACQKYLRDVTGTI